MALQSSGSISLSQIQSEFGGSNPIRLSEYYKDSSPKLITDNSENASVPNFGQSISLNDFYGADKGWIIAYEIIGAGGAGGYARADDYGSGYAQSGTDSTLTGSGITTVTAVGGAGGANANLSPSPTKPPDGEATVYGPGGVSSNNKESEDNQTPGGDAPATSYGAGGGGAGGDRSQTFDSSGGAGSPGSAGTYLTGSFSDIVPGTVITVTIGAKGVGATGQRGGGDGAGGYARLRVDGYTWVEFTADGTFTVPETPA